MIFQYGLESVLQRLARYTQTERHPVTFFMFKIRYDAMNEAILVFLHQGWLQTKAGGSREGTVGISHAVEVVREC